MRLAAADDALEDLDLAFFVVDLGVPFSFLVIEVSEVGVDGWVAWMGFGVVDGKRTRACMS